jgi:uncharacterized protein YxeA
MEHVMRYIIPLFLIVGTVLIFFYNISLEKDQTNLQINISSQEIKNGTEKNKNTKKNTTIDKNKRTNFAKVIKRPTINLGGERQRKQTTYRKIYLNGKEKIITNKIFFKKNDLNKLKKIFPQKNIIVRAQHIEVSIDFKNIKEIQNKLKAVNIKFNHELLRPSPKAL